MRDRSILNRHAQAKSLARPDISAKVGNVALSQLPEITRRKNNRVRGASVKRWLANARGISPRGVEQQAQSRNLNMGLVAKGNNPVRQRGMPTDPATGSSPVPRHAAPPGGPLRSASPAARGRRGAPALRRPGGGVRRGWSRTCGCRRRRAAQPDRLAPVAGALRSGVDPLGAYGDYGRNDPVRGLVAALARAMVSGAPLAETVAAVADDQRRRRRWSAEAAAHRAGVHAVGPLVVCFLPAFVLLGVVPVVLGIAAEVLGGLS